jgi:hypothetical protein
MAGRWTSRTYLSTEFTFQSVDFALLLLYLLVGFFFVAAGADQLSFLSFDAEDVASVVFNELSILVRQFVNLTAYPAFFLADVLVLSS